MSEPKQLKINLRKEINKAEAALSEALARVTSANAPAIIEACWSLYEHAQSNKALTSDPIWYYLERDHPEVLVGAERRFMGAVFRRCAACGLIERTDSTKKSIRPKCHRREVRIWKSLIYQGKP